MSRQRPLEPLELLGDLAQLAHDLAGSSGRSPRRCPRRPRAPTSDRLPRLKSCSASSLYSSASWYASSTFLRETSLVGLEQVLAPRARRPCASLLGRLADVELADAQDVDHQHRVVRDDRAPRLGDDGRVRHAAGVADLLQREDDVVGVLLHRVVHRRREVGLRAVVVDAQAAAHVEVLERRAQLDDLDEEAPRLAQRVLDRADRRDLAAEVEVQQLEAAQQVVRAQEVDRLDHLARRQAELRAVAARGLPAPRALGRQLDAHADARPHADLLRDLGDERQLGELLDDDDHRAPQLRRHERGLDVLLVLVAVADDRAPLRRRAWP